MLLTTKMEGDDGEPVITAGECAELRRAVNRGNSIQELAERYETEYSIVQHHLWGRCSHDVDEPPAPIE